MIDPLAIGREMDASKQLHLPSSMVIEMLEGRFDGDGRHAAKEWPIGRRRKLELSTRKFHRSMHFERLSRKCRSIDPEHDKLQTVSLNRV